MISLDFQLSGTAADSEPQMSSDEEKVPAKLNKVLGAVEMTARKIQFLDIKN